MFVCVDTRYKTSTVVLGGSSIVGTVVTQFATHPEVSSVKQTWLSSINHHTTVCLLSVLTFVTSSEWKHETVEKDFGQSHSTIVIVISCPGFGNRFFHRL